MRLPLAPIHCEEADGDYFVGSDDFPKLTPFIPFSITASLQQKVSQRSFGSAEVGGLGVSLELFNFGKITVGVDVTSFICYKFHKRALSSGIQLKSLHTIHWCSFQ